MKNLLLTSFVATFLFSLSCKQEKDPPRISYEIGQEIGQLLNHTFVLLTESGRMVAGEFSDCPFDTIIGGGNPPDLTVYNCFYSTGCTLPNGLFAEGDFAVYVFNKDSVTGYDTRQLAGNQFFINDLNMWGLYYVGQRSDNRWATNMTNLFLRDDNGNNLKLNGIPNFFIVQGNDTPTTTDNVWTLDLSDTVDVWVPSLQTNLSLHTDPLNPLEFSSGCAYIRSGILYINNDEALLVFGEGACDNKFWLEWSSGAAVLVTY